VRGRQDAVQAIAHDVWRTQYSNASKTHLDLDVHVAHAEKDALLSLPGAEKTGELIEDVHTLVDAEAKARTGVWDREASKRVIGAKADPFFDEYRPNEEIDEYLQLLATLHPEIAEYVPNIGPSVQGNPIRAIIIGGSDGGPAIYNQCGIHAREWITHSTCMYLIVELLESPDPLVRRLVSEIRFVFVPNGNPDGYVWTWADNGSRLWRENRQVPPAGSSCFGVDLNRNFDDHWNDGPPGCSSANPCSQTYHGTGPASEPEVAAMQNLAIEIGQTHQYLGAIDWHSFTQLILRPYGWVAPPTVPPNDGFAESVGDAMAAAIESVHGMAYTNQPSADLYPVCGCAIDFLYETTLGVTFTMELRPATSLGGGFILPPAQIVPTGEENMEGFVVYADRVLQGFKDGSWSPRNATSTRAL
jgi:hypothetical protein